MSVTFPILSGPYELLHALALSPRVSSYLGIGVQEGFCVAEVVRAKPTIDLTLCDTWGPVHGGTNRGSHAHIDRLLLELHHQGTVTYLDGDSQVEIPRWPGPVDLSYVDGDHSEAYAHDDCREAWMRTRWAMVVHDTHMPSVWAGLTSCLVEAAHFGDQFTVHHYLGTTGTTVVVRP